MATTNHFQLHPDYTDDEGNFYAVDTTGSFYLLARSVLEDDRIDRRGLSDDMVMLTIDEKPVVEDVVLSDDLAPDEVPIVDGF